MNPGINNNTIIKYNNTMADNIEVGFKMTGLDVITKNTQQLKNELSLIEKLSGKIKIDNSNVDIIKRMNAEIAKLGNVSKITDEELDEITKSILDAVDAQKELEKQFKKIPIPVDKFEELSDKIKDAGKDIASAAAEALVAAEGFGGVAKNITEELGILAIETVHPIGIAVELALSALAPLAETLFDVDEATKALAESTSNIISEYAEEKGALDDLFQPLFNVTLSTKERTAAIDKLKEAYPDYLGGMEIEKLSVGQLLVLYDRLNIQLITNAVNKEKAIAQDKIRSEQVANELEILKTQQAVLRGEIVNGGKNTLEPLIEKQAELNNKLAESNLQFSHVTTALISGRAQYSAYDKAVRTVDITIGNAAKNLRLFLDGLRDVKTPEYKSKDALDKEEKDRKEAEENQKKALAERKQRESKALQERLRGINKINEELDKEIKKLNDLAKNGSTNEVAEQQQKVLEVQERQIKAIDDAEKATRNYLEVSKELADLREKDAENDKRNSLIQQEKALQDAIIARSKAELEAFADLQAQFGDGGAFFDDIISGIDSEKFQAIIDEFGEGAAALDELRKAGALFKGDFQILNGEAIAKDKAALDAIRKQLADLGTKGGDAAKDATKTVQDRLVQGAKDANRAFFETLGTVDPELVKAGVKSFEQSLDFLIARRNDAAAKLIDEKQGLLSKFNTLFGTDALSIADEKISVDESKLIEAKGKLRTEEEVKAFENQVETLRKVIQLSNDGKLALDINYEIARNKLQITYNDEYIAAYKQRFDDVTRLSQLEYDEALFAQEQFTNAELDQFKKAATERKKLKKKQTQEEKDNILFAKQEALTLLERQFDEENELLQKQQLDPLNALRAKLEDAELKPEEKAAIAKKIELQQREAELAIAKTQTNQSKKRTAVSASFDNLIEEDGTETQETIKEITEIAKASQQLIGELFDYAIQADQARLDLLNEQLTGLDEQISNTQGKISELEDDLEGKRSGRRDAVLQAIELEKQREIDLANQKIALEKKIAEEQRKIRIKEQAAAIAQAIINGALSITAITTVPDFTLGVASAIRIGLVAASTAAQVATIASQKFAKGGILDGASHANGGIQTPFGELEGGEAVINKNSTRMFAPLLSQINEAGGGKRFATGGILDTQSLADNSNSASGKDVVGLASMNQMNQQLLALQNRPIYVRPTEVANMAASTARMIQSTMI